MGFLFARLVQILVCVSLLAIIVAAILVFAKTMAQKRGKSIILKFLLVELILIICSGVALSLFAGPPRNGIEGFTVFIAISIGLAMLANLPVAIIAKLVQVVFLRKGKSLE